MLLQSIALCMQALDFAGDGPSTLTHIIANNALSYLMLACLGAGVFGSWRAKSKKENLPVMKVSSASI